MAGSSYVDSLAAALGGNAVKATLDDMNTPNSAFVLVTINGKPLRIAFLNGVLGVTRRALEEGVAIIEVPLRLKARSSGRRSRSFIRSFV